MLFPSSLSADAPARRAGMSTRSSGWRQMAERIDWPTVLAEAKAIVESYTTGVTLRQLFYRLVANQTLVNTSSAYKSLSSRTAQARRDDVFPDLIDRGRSDRKSTRLKYSH